MKKAELIKAATDKEFTFKVRRLGSEIALRYYGVRISPERFITEVLTGRRGELLLRVLLHVATQDEELLKRPKTWWQMFKAQYFPKWLLRRFPVQMEEIWVTHKFPELEIPEYALGREFVHLRIINADALRKLAEATSQ